MLGLYTQTHCRKDFRKPQARYIYPPGAINRTILYERTGGGLLRGQAMPVAQIPLRPLQIHLRIHGTGAGIQVHYPQKHFTTQEYTKENLLSFVNKVCSASFEKIEVHNWAGERSSSCWDGFSHTGKTRDDFHNDIKK